MTDPGVVFEDVLLRLFPLLKSNSLAWDSSELKKEEDNENEWHRMNDEVEFVFLHSILVPQYSSVTNKQTNTGVVFEEVLFDLRFHYFSCSLVFLTGTARPCLRQREII